MQSVVDAIIVEWGWRRAAIALVAGAVSALAFAPYDAVPVLWLTVPVLVFLLDGAVGLGRSVFSNILPAALVGWLFGFGFFLAGLWWLGAAFLVDAGEFAWFLPLAVVGLPAGLALFFAFAAAAARLFWCDGWPRVVIFAVAMSFAEWLRGHILTGLPWNTFGYALMPHPLLMQSASLIGLWGMTFLTFLIAAAPAALYAGSRQDRRGRVAFVALAIVLLAAHAGFGAFRLNAAGSATVEGVRLRIVQPNVPQGEKWAAGKADEIFDRILSLSASAAGAEQRGLPGVTHLVWPETVFPFILTETPDALTALSRLLPDGTMLIAGAVRREAGRAPDQADRFYNSIFVIDDAGQIESAYDKVHLVPFGEYLPFQKTLERLGLRQLTGVVGGFSAGVAHRPLAAGTAPAFSPLICYEAIFPEEAAPAGERPGWLLNVTNDAWYGDTPGPRQHFRQAAVRAVEQGLPLVRAANSGISAIVDAYGRTRSRLDVGVSGVLDGALPAAAPKTVYVSYGNAAYWILLLLASTCALVGRRRQVS